MRIALDTNVLAYAAGVDRSPEDTAKIAIARRVMTDLAQSATLVAPVQALGELFVVLLRSGQLPDEARRIVLEFSQSLAGAESRGSTLAGALDLVIDHKMQFWDALIVSASVDAGCTLLLSEDMQDGLVVRGLTVVNPFAGDPHRKLQQALPGINPQMG